MPGIIKNWLHRLKSLYLRTLLFNNDTRAYFYATLREYLGSHFPLLGVFDHVQQHGNNPAIQEIARLSKRAIRNNQPFATHYYRTGLFTEQESKLLMLGHRYGVAAGPGRAGSGTAANPLRQHPVDIHEPDHDRHVHLYAALPEKLHQRLCPVL